MPGQQAPIHFCPGPEHHGLQRHIGPAAPHTGHLCRSQHEDTSGSTVWVTHWSPWLLGARDRVWFLYGLSWVLYLEERQNRDRTERRAGLAPCPVHAEGALRPWGTEV